MQYDVFIPISDVPLQGQGPTQDSYVRFMERVLTAERLGFKVVWIAECWSNPSSSSAPDLDPMGWRGEIGRSVNFLQIAQHIYTRTQRIEVGAAVLNIQTRGGPTAAAKRVAAFLEQRASDPKDTRKLHVGFSDTLFMAPNGRRDVTPKSRAEQMSGQIWKEKVFAEAVSIFVRLLSGETLSSKDIPVQTLVASDFARKALWDNVLASHGQDVVQIPVQKQWHFEATSCGSTIADSQNLSFVIGTETPQAQIDINQIAPVQVFRLRASRQEVEEALHDRMSLFYHKDGGKWHRQYMPRVVRVFINGAAALEDEEQSEVARAEASEAFIRDRPESTDDVYELLPRFLSEALIGNPNEIAQQIVRRFHPDDRLILQFDVGRHDPKRVLQDMELYYAHVTPLVDVLLGSN